VQAVRRERRKVRGPAGRMVRGGTPAGIGAF
jgi:hypothetical protein